MLTGEQDALHDVLIVGGGPAGLSTAGHLVRSAFDIVVFDSGQYRNALAPELHGIPGWDHEDPATIRERMQSNLLGRYSKYVSIIQTEITGIESASEEHTSLFVAINVDGRKWRGRKVVLATGVSDILPSQHVLGYEACWVKGIFSCLTSQGIEKKWTADSALPPSAGVLAIGDCAAPPLCVRLAAQTGQLVPRVRIYTHGDADLTDRLVAMVKPTETSRVTIEKRKIARLLREKAGDSDGEEVPITVVFEDGTETTEAFLVHKPTMRINGKFAQQLGLKMLPHIGHELIHAEPPFNQTSVPGVFAVGDCASPQKVYAQALAMGACTAAGLGGQLLMGGV